MCLDVETRPRTPQSRRMYATREAGAAGSIGTYVAPDLSTANIVTTLLADFGMKSPTRLPRSSAQAMSVRASVVLSSSSSA
jgi:hypothetical protein